MSAVNAAPTASHLEFRSRWCQRLPPLAEAMAASLSLVKEAERFFSSARSACAVASWAPLEWQFSILSNSGFRSTMGIELVSAGFECKLTTLPSGLGWSPADSAELAGNCDFRAKKPRISYFKFEIEELEKSDEEASDSAESLTVAGGELDCGCTRCVSLRFEPEMWIRVAGLAGKSAGFWDFVIPFPSVFSVFACSVMACGSSRDCC